MAPKKARRKRKTEDDQPDDSAKRIRHIDPNQWSNADVAEYVAEQGQDPEPFEVHSRSYNATSP